MGQTPISRIKYPFPTVAGTLNAQQPRRGCQDLYDFFAVAALAQADSMRRFKHASNIANQLASSD